MNNNNTLLSPPLLPPLPQFQPNYPLNPHQSGLMSAIPIYISHHPAFQDLVNLLTPFDMNYSTQNSHLLSIFPHVVQVSHATMEELTNTPLKQNYPTPLPILIEERLTGSLIRLTATQLELTQELTTLELYNILHQTASLSNLNMQHLQLVYQLNNFVNYSLQQMLGIQWADLRNENTTVSEEDDHMEDQLVPQMYTRGPSPPIHHATTIEMREKALTIPELDLKTLYLRNYLIIDMQQNIERKIMIKVPKEFPKMSLNIRCYNANMTPKYVALLIPTMKGKQTLVEATPSKNPNSVNLEMTLAPGGKPTPNKELSMKILLWTVGVHAVLILRGTYEL
ncbi:hypothetical protein KY290_032630 [Solanum tuberosum]|uniref:Major sperm protein n=1 Tax=Solanum tuberosum TaxID=4113 RepID=A0ABQ7UCN6_SOLTU|nr:hypothetical protein KY289_030093 [Solanum tuberosum]KAH0744637.1 hypothetical protein KY290_032630 [Solanum tuberosum]